MSQGIDMKGQTIGAVHVLARSSRVSARGAYWHCLCMRCREQFYERGTDLRRSQRAGRYAAGCHRCSPAKVAS